MTKTLLPSFLSKNDKELFSQLAKVTSGIDHYRNVTDINQCRELPLFSFLPTRETPPLPHSWTFHGRLTSSIITPIPTRGVAGEKQMCTILFSFPQHANRRIDPNPAMVTRLLLPPTPAVHDPSSPLDLEHGKRRSCKAFLMDQWLKLIWSCKRVDELAQTHPSFLTLKSVDLSPNKLDGCFLPLLISIVHKCYTEFSSLNRYPIYIVPSRNNEKELEACFLTYHTLPSSFEGVAYTSCFIPCLRMLLSTFYKL
ncbi:hypothetical protein V8G54_009949 [Vigna mungo]|uniref:Uncharacterized protein n=1 Tax=Vigna mungo TaxID=3915 RepID=A0AAQ3S4E4_VIGMU